MENRMKYNSNTKLNEQVFNFDLEIFHIFPHDKTENNTFFALVTFISLILYIILAYKN